MNKKIIIYVRNDSKLRKYGVPYKIKTQQIQGEWAIHFSVTFESKTNSFVVEDTYSVTHYPSGLAANVHLSLKQAKLLLAKLKKVESWNGEGSLPNSFRQQVRKIVGGKK